jgi:hypothetical protein
MALVAENPPLCLRIALRPPFPNCAVLPPLITPYRASPDRTIHPPFGALYSPEAVSGTYGKRSICHWIRKYIMYKRLYYGSTSTVGT